MSTLPKPQIRLGADCSMPSMKGPEGNCYPCVVIPVRSHKDGRYLIKLTKSMREDFEIHHEEKKLFNKAGL